MNIQDSTIHTYVYSYCKYIVCAIYNMYTYMYVCVCLYYKCHVANSSNSKNSTGGKVIVCSIVHDIFGPEKGRFDQFILSGRKKLCIVFCFLLSMFFFLKLE